MTTINYKEVIASANPLLCTDADKYSLKGQVHPALIYKAYDADTVRACIFVDGKVSWRSVRIQHFDSAEIKTKDAIEKELAEEAKARTKELTDNKICCLVCGKFDKYGRLLADIINPDGVDVSQTILQEYLGFPYEGGKKKQDWKFLHHNRQVYKRLGEWGWRCWECKENFNSRNHLFEHLRKIPTHETAYNCFK